MSGNYDTEDSSIQGVGRTASTITSIVYGCMDATQFGYNDAATIDDGSCVNFNHGCTDDSADNYSSSANTDDGSCIWYGCTAGPLASWAQELSGGSMNFDPNANVDDGSCIPAVWGCTIAGSYNYNPAATFGSAIQSDGTVCGYVDCMCISMIPGCTDAAADNYITPVDEMTDVNYDDGSCEYLGCTDPIATNYSFTGSSPVVDGPNGNLTYLNGTAVDDGSCTYIGGCMDPIACNYDVLATVDNGSCTYCGDTSASVVNFDNADPGCTTGCEYCYGPTNLQIVSQTTADAGMSNGIVTIEWTESTSPSINYYGITFGASFVTVVDSGTGTGTYTITGLPTGTINIVIHGFCDKVLGNYAIGLGPNTNVTITSTPIPGCTDGTGANNNASGTWGACNYDASATVDDGSCEYVTCTGCNDNTFLEFCGDCWDTINQVVVASGGSAWVADTIPTSCTTLIVPGCMDATAINYDAAATADDGSCIAPIPGCIDATLNNDGSNAVSNYSAIANIDDGSCLPYNCPYDLNIYINASGTNFSFKVLNFTTPYAFSDITRTATIGGVVITTYNSSGNVYQGANMIGRRFYEPTAGYFTAGDTSIDVDFNVTTSDGNCDVDALSKTFTIGCNDPTAALAGTFDITDNTQCEYLGCMDATACNTTVGATIDDGSCTYPGCNDPLADNFDSAAGCNDGSCVYTGCTDSTMDADGQAQGADNYLPTYNIMCGANADNECCTYTGTPEMNVVVGGNSLIRQFINTGTVYDEGMVTSWYYGTQYISGNTLYTSLNASSGINTPSQAGTSELIWGPYVSNGVLDVELNTNWSGDIANTFLSNTLTTTTQNTFQFTAGCRDGNNTHVNWDNTLDLHVTHSCVTAISGCTDTTAVNYDATATVDCSNTPIAPYGSGVDYAYCCCYGCAVPSWQNPFLDNIVVDTSATPNVVSSVDLHFNPVNTGVTYRVFWKRDDTTYGSTWQQHDITNATAVQTGDYTFAPGVTTATPNGGFDKNTQYKFYLLANCDGCVAWSDPSTILTHFFDF